jgi:hypothetical protein
MFLSMLHITAGTAIGRDLDGDDRPKKRRRFVDIETGRDITINHLYTDKQVIVIDQNSISNTFYIRLPNKGQSPAYFLVPTKSPLVFRKIKLSYILKDYYIYKISHGLPLGNDGSVRIKMFAGIDSNEIVFAKPLISEAQPASTKDPCIDLTPETMFGEQSQSYDKNKIVYVFDFNNGTKNNFYRIRKKRGKLEIDVKHPSSDRLNANDYIIVKIVGINKFLYNAAIEDSIVNLDPEPPALFNQLFAGDTSILGVLMSSFSGMLSNKSVSDGIASDALLKPDGALDKALRMMTRLRAEHADAFSPLCDNWPCCAEKRIVDPNKLGNTLLDARVELAKYEISVKGIQAEITQRKEELKKCEAQQKKREENDKEIKHLDELLKTSSDTEKKELEKKIEKLKAENNAMAQCASIADIRKALVEAEKQLLDISSLLHLSQLLPTVDQLENLTIFLNHKVRANQMDVFGPYYADGNKLNLDLTIASRDSVFKRSSLSAYHHTPIHIEIPVIWRPYITFSSGPFLALGDRLNNKTYDWQKIPTSNGAVTDSSKYRLVESGYTVQPLGFSALGHVEWNIRRNVGIGFCVGAGITIETKPRVAYLAGASAFFGKDRQFTINAGLMAMNVEKLSNNLVAVVAEAITYPKTENISYYDELRTGAFVSLGYTPLKINRKEKKGK